MLTKINVKEWLIAKGYTTSTEQITHPEQGYLRAIQALTEEVNKAIVYNETLVLKMACIKEFKREVDFIMEKIYSRIRSDDYE